MRGIVKLTAENFKKLTAVEITPFGNTIVIAGKNRAGKTSVIDAIEAALRGKEAIPVEPIRRGQDKARIVVELDDYVITRSFTKLSSYLTVAAKAGGTIKSPQSLLDSLVSRIAFDPMEFVRMKPNDRTETLKRVAGLDFTDIETRRKKAFEDRTAVNRDVVRCNGAIASLGARRPVANEDKDAAGLTAERDRRAKHNAEIDAVESDWAAENDRLTEHRSNFDECDKEIVRLLGLVDIQKAKRSQFGRAIDESLVRLKAIDGRRSGDRLDLAAIDADLAAIGTRAENIAHNKKIDDAVVERDKAQSESDRLTKAIDDLDVEKKAKIKSAKMPVDGLGVDETGVTFGGIPWDQVNTATHIRVSVAIGLALNPKLPVLLVRNGNDLDADSLAIVAGMAEAAGAQVWVERIGESGPVSVMIEDGAVASQPNDKIETKQAEPEPEDFDATRF